MGAFIGSMDSLLEARYTKGIAVGVSLPSPLGSAGRVGLYSRPAARSLSASPRSRRPAALPSHGLSSPSARPQPRPTSCEKRSPDTPPHLGNQSTLSPRRWPGGAPSFPSLARLSARRQVNPPSGIGRC